MRPPLTRLAVCVGLLLLACAASTTGGAAQQASTTQPAPAILLEPLGISPGGAFLRSVLVPGWGHAAIGSYRRGGFYFALESATAYTYLRTRRRLSEARAGAAFRENAVRANLAAEGIIDAAEIQERLGQDAALQSFQDLVESREGQHEDLVAFGLFVLFLSGADAYVSAHLARFPAPIEVQVSPVAAARGGAAVGAEVGVRIAVPGLW